MSQHPLVTFVGFTGSMADDSAVRRDRLNAYCVKRGWVSQKNPGVGSPSALIKKLGRSSSFWSDRLRGESEIGAELAREIEEKLELPRYYLDDATGWPFTRALQQTIDKLSEEDLVYAENALRAHLKMPAVATPGPISGESTDSKAERMRANG